MAKNGGMDIYKMECEVFDMEFMRFPLCRAEAINNSNVVINARATLLVEAKYIKVIVY